jgi:triosephosphate isomerase (TIM)
MMSVRSANYGRQMPLQLRMQAANPINSIWDNFQSWATSLSGSAAPAEPVSRPIVRRPIVGGNWKCNLNQEGARKLVASLNELDAEGCDVVVAPIALHIPIATAALKPAVAVAAQNCNFKGTGAYTGELAPEQLVDAGVRWVILGHSERRSYFKEDNDILRAKLEAARAAGLSVIFCIGESLQEREEERTREVLVSQLKPVVDLLDPAGVVIAYEPIWAIGTGKTATPQMAQDTHKEIRDYLATVNPEVASNIRIQYGGSATAANAPELSICPDIDGFLVGGASLKPEFADIVRAIATAKAAAAK